jgi:hypothetical protein
MRHTNLKADMTDTNLLSDKILATKGGGSVKPRHQVSLTTRFKPKLVALTPYLAVFNAQPV